MIALIQRVSRASVTVDGESVGTIGSGILALIGIERGDAHGNAKRMLQRLLSYRIFSDAEGRMNLSLQDTGGGLLLVPQFTLAADTSKGTRPGFSTAAAPEDARELFNSLLDLAHNAHTKVAAGRFGAHMSIELVNEGPVTFRLKA